jgi:hypothetical protein
MTQQPAQHRTIRPPEGDGRYELFACYLFMSPSYWLAHQLATNAVELSTIQGQLPPYFPEVKSTYAALGSVYEGEFDDWWVGARKHFGFGEAATTPTCSLAKSPIEETALWWRLRFLRAVGGKRTVNKLGELIAHQQRLTHARIWEWLYQVNEGRDVVKGTIKPTSPDPSYVDHNDHWRTERPLRRNMADSYVKDVADKSARKALRLAFVTSEWAARGSFPSTAPISCDRFSSYLLTPALQERIRARSARSLELEREAFRLAHPGQHVRIDHWVRIDGISRQEVCDMVDGLSKAEAVEWLKDLQRNRRAMQIVAPNAEMVKLIQERARRERW